MGDCLWVGCVCGVKKYECEMRLLEKGFWGCMAGGILCWNEMDVC